MSREGLQAKALIRGRRCGKVTHTAVATRPERLLQNQNKIFCEPSSMVADPSANLWLSNSVSPRLLWQQSQQQPPSSVCSISKDSSISGPTLPSTSSSERCSQMGYFPWGTWQNRSLGFAILMHTGLREQLVQPCCAPLSGCWCFRGFGRHNSKCLSVPSKRHKKSYTCEHWPREKKSLFCNFLWMLHVLPLNLQHCRSQSVFMLSSPQLYNFPRSQEMLPLFPDSASLQQCFSASATPMAFPERFLLLLSLCSLPVIYQFHMNIPYKQL